MRISRDDILQAIDKERLIAEDWVGYDIDRPDCPVCAVGAVLRGAGLENQEIMDRAGAITGGAFIASKSLPAALGAGNWLGALSIKWERMCEAAKPSEWWTWEPKRLEAFKPALKEWVLQTLPEGVIYDDEQLP